MGAMAAMARSTGYDDHNFWGRLADSLTNPGWSYGVLLASRRGAPLGDGFSIWNWNESRRLMRLAAVAGYPEAMAEAGAYLDEYGFCPAGLEWPLEAALRGYKYAWYYVGYNYEKGCPQDGIPPDLLTAYAGYDIVYRYTDFGSPESRDRVAALLDDGQLDQARTRSEELVKQRNDRLQVTMEAQRKRIRQGLPAVRDKINQVLDECIANGVGYGMTVEELQRLRDL